MIPAVHPGVTRPADDPGGLDTGTPQIDIEPPGYAVLVVGCGNLLRGDDGVGPVLVRHLWERGVPDGARLVDGGTAGMDVAFQMRGAAAVVIIDAFRNGGRRREPSTGCPARNSTTCRPCRVCTPTRFGGTMPSRSPGGRWGGLPERHHGVPDRAANVALGADLSEPVEKAMEG